MKDVNGLRGNGPRKLLDETDEILKKEKDKKFKEEKHNIWNSTGVLDIVKGELVCKDTFAQYGELLCIMLT